jgi:hypothetical protein
MEKFFEFFQLQNLQKWVQKRFGIINFSSTVPAGLEIELEGGSGTAGSHPEQTLYFSDLMAGVISSEVKITELTFVAMLDSGWYDVDFRGTQRLIFGYGPSIGENILTTFPMEPPQLY